LVTVSTAERPGGQGEMPELAVTIG